MFGMLRAYQLDRVQPQSTAMCIQVDPVRREHIVSAFEHPSWDVEDSGTDAQQELLRASPRFVEVEQYVTHGIIYTPLIHKHQW